MTHEIINPESLGAPRGYSNGILAGPGRLLFVAGQIGWSSGQALVSPSFADQFEQALANVLSVVEQAGGRTDSICRFTIFVVDRHEYMAAAKEVGEGYRRKMGRHYPAMSLVEVKALLEPGAKVEIEATAVIE